MTDRLCYDATQVLWFFGNKNPEHQTTVNEMIRSRSCGSFVRKNHA